MPSITNQPSNINFLSPLGFRFKLSRAPTVDFFIINANLPSISLSNVELPTPFKNLEIAGNKLEYGDFNITFRLDQNMAAYFEIYNWMIGLGYPENFGQYAVLKNAATGSKETLYSDATLTILNNDMVPNVEVNFYDLFPVTLAQVDFNVTDSDVNYITLSASFKYRIFHVNKL